MAREAVPLFAFNAGQVSEEALGRVDLAKMRLAGTVQKNLLPKVIGPMAFRPGTAFIAQTVSDQEPFLMPFVFNTETTALAVITTGGIQVMVAGVFVTRPAVTTAVANGSFTTDLASWTDSDEAGAASVWVTGGFLSLTGTGINYAIRQQSVTTVETGVEHALRVVVRLGPVKFQVGTTAGGKDIFDTMLGTGEHSLGFTPAGDFHITVSANNLGRRLVDSIEVEASGRMTLPNPWGSSFQNLRYAQSGDIIYIACEDVQQQQFERRSQRAWSIVSYDALDGPFRKANLDQGTTLTPSATVGAITLTANRALFTTDHVGGIWQLVHSGQFSTGVLAGDNQFTNPIKVTGIESNRVFVLSLSGVVDSTLTLQKSVGEVGSWVDTEQYTADITKSINDDNDNQIIYYRWGIKTGDYGTDTVTAELTFSGIQKGVVRVLNFTSSTVVSAEVLSALGKAEATSNWSEGEWSAERGFPGSVQFHDGRLGWGWRDRIYLSVSDGFNSYDPTVVGDSAPVIRSVATGAVEGIRWLLSMQYLLAGTASQEVSMRGDNFGEGITPTKFTARDFSNRGCANLNAVKVDSRGVFVQRSLRKVFEITYSVDAQDYVSGDLTRLCPDICADDIVSIAVQRQPDTRVWFILDNGSAVVLTYERDDEVVAWTTVETTGLIKAVAVLPGSDEDEVYFAVQREITGTDSMCIEKLSMLSECVGGTLSKNLDSHIIYAGAPDTTISGLDHLNGLSVAVWADGAPVAGTYLVTAGTTAALPAAVSNAVVGLPFTGQFKSVKLAYAASSGTALSQAKRVDHVSLLMKSTTWDGVRVGRTFDEMTGLSATSVTGALYTTGQVVALLDDRPQPFNGGWGPDERLCLQVTSPHCATFMAAAIGISSNDGQIRAGNQSQD
jgi:hypothetical protein